MLQKCDICSNLIIKKHHSDVNNVVLVFLVLTLNIFRMFVNVNVNVNQQMLAGQLFREHLQTR